MSGRYLVCVKCVLLNRRNAPNKTTSKKTICKGCVENSFIILFAGTLFIKKKSVQGLNQQFANDVLRIVSLQFVLFPGTLFIKKKVCKV